MGVTSLAHPAKFGRLSIPPAAAPDRHPRPARRSAPEQTPPPDPTHGGRWGVPAALPFGPPDEPRCLGGMLGVPVRAVAPRPPPPPGSGPWQSPRAPPWSPPRPAGPHPLARPRRARSLGPALPSQRKEVLWRRRRQRTERAVSESRGLEGRGRGRVHPTPAAADWLKLAGLRCGRG